MTLILIIVTALFSIIAFNSREFFIRMQFNPYLVIYKKQLYRLLSHGFIHANWTHLIFNMISLYFFATYVEQAFPSKWLFLFFYLSVIVFASTTTLFKHKNNSWYNSVGASGGVSAIIFASIIYEPFSKIIIIPIPIPIPAIIYGILFLIYSQYMSKKNSDNINHDAHFLGALYGIIFPILINPEIVPAFFQKIINLFS